GDLDSAFEPLWPAHDHLVDQHFLEPAVEAALEDDALVVAILGEPLDFGTLDGQRALVLVDAAAREYTHLDDRAGDAWRQPQRGVANIRGLLAEDGAQQFLFWRHRRFALRRDFADQDIARLHFGADIDDPRLVEILQGLFADIRDVAGDLLLTQLRVARHHLEFLDMNRGEDIVADDSLGNEDGILKVVALPRHECAEHIAAQRQFAKISRRSVGDDIAGG